NELYKIRKTMEAALITIEEMKAQLLNPKWEYRIILPNMMNSSGQSREGIHDGVNFNLMGKDGWELVNYSVQYGFIFKKRVH
ncbi:MAG: hypothetical protein MI747_22230, partial [Desulfobacterales bacterium]|nr:hypothetical protein [Desulfobacterales bacterium]